MSTLSQSISHSSHSYKPWVLFSCSAPRAESGLWVHGFTSPVPQQFLGFLVAEQKGTPRGVGALFGCGSGAPRFPAVRFIHRAWSSGGGSNQRPAACFCTKLARLLCQKHQPAGKNPRLVYHLPLATDLIPGPRVPALHEAPQARPSSLGDGERIQRVTEEGTGDKAPQTRRNEASAAAEAQQQHKGSGAGAFCRFSLLQVPAGVSHPSPNAWPSSTGAPTQPPALAEVPLLRGWVREPPLPPNALPVRKGTREICSQLHFI